MNQLKINSTATLEKIRAGYPSAAAFARECGGSARQLYFALAGERGQSRRRSVERQMLERLQAEGLLVVEHRQEDRRRSPGRRAVNGH